MTTKRTPDPRHAAVKELLAKYWAAENPELPEMPWGAADAGALGQFLQANPTLSTEQIAQLLRNRFKSEDHAAGEPVFVWIKYLTRYLHGRLNRFRQPIDKAQAARFEPGVHQGATEEIPDDEFQALRRRFEKRHEKL